MAEKELRHMSRTELIEIIYAVQQEEQLLRRENDELKSRLNDRQIRMDNAGSIAEAALSLNRVFEDAQAAAQDYLLSIKNGTGARGGASDAGDDEIDEARKEARQILAEAQIQAEQIRQRGVQAAAKEKEKFQRSVNSLLSQNPELAAALKGRSEREDDG